MHEAVNDVIVNVKMLTSSKSSQDCRAVSTNEIRVRINTDTKI
jgi:hypothetical protein